MLGLFSCGGFALALLLAVGGFSAGYYAYGGAAFGVHTLSSLGQDPAAVALFHPWAHQWSRWLVWLTAGWLATYFVITAIAWGMIRHQERSEPLHD